MLNPNRVSGSWFARKKTVKWEFERRLPVRYTASNSPRRTNRAVRGNSRPSGLFGREPMASLLAARRQNFAASYGLHAYTKSVRLGAPPFPRLICSLWQSNPPLLPIPKLPISDYVPRAPHVSVAALRASRLHKHTPVDGLRVLAGLQTGQPIPSTQPFTSRVSSPFRISKCSRPPRTRSRKLRGSLKDGLLGCVHLILVDTYRCAHNGQHPYLLSLRPDGSHQSLTTLLRLGREIVSCLLPSLPKHIKPFLFSCA